MTTVKRCERYFPQPNFFPLFFPDMDIGPLDLGKSFIILSMLLLGIPTTQKKHKKTRFRLTCHGASDPSRYQWVDHGSILRLIGMPLMYQMKNLVVMSRLQTTCVNN